MEGGGLGREAAADRQMAITQSGTAARILIPDRTVLR
jgi:hypothetical protein